LLGNLHQEGATICMVTHDPRFARHADRIVNLFDGRVVEDTAVQKQIRRPRPCSLTFLNAP